jgi:DNA helicase-2/ATP-dependent DNA helicase PcrA
MQASKHPEHNEEQQRLENTQKAIDAFVGDSARPRNAGADGWANAALDKHNRDMVSKYRNERSNPYFGRLDFQTETDPKPERIYLGYQALNLGRFEVVDWRAPIGSLFAGSSAENQGYRSPGGMVKGRLLLRRRYRINNGCLEQITDEFDRRPKIKTEHKLVEFTSNEEYLLQELYSRGDPRLQDIVKTIQKQQDEIIRARHDRIVVINGVAGSGKTSIAIHRMAYLLYPASQTNIRAARSIIFCPNPIFLHYVEDLLPRLGERDVQQTTFAEWALTRMQLKGKYQIVDSSQVIFLNSSSDLDLLKKSWLRARMKGNLKIKQLLNNYVEYLKHNHIIPENGLAYRQIGELNLDFTFSPDELNDAIQNSLSGQFEALAEIRQNALFSLQQLIQDKYDQDVFAKEEEFIKQANLLEELAAGMEDPEERKLLLEEANSHRTFRTRAFSIPITKRRITSLVGALLQKDFDQIWKPIRLVEDYYSLFQNEDLLVELANGVFKDRDIHILSSDNAKAGTIEIEDLAALLYFHELVYGRFSGKYDHIIVDEVQDFSPLQLELIYSTSTEHSMTLVGDIAQGIHAYRGISAWSELTDILPEEKVSLENVTQSYRSTRELVNFANEVLKQIRKENPLLAEPFVRQGKPPVIVHVSAPDRMKEELLARIRTLQKSGLKNIAVIAKTMEQAVSLIAFLDTVGVAPQVSIQDLETEFKYSGGLVVLPVVLTKGMEFEAVIVYNANETQFSSQKIYDGRLLYVAVTRALHEMQILYTGQLSGFLKSAKEIAKSEQEAWQPTIETNQGHSWEKYHESR